MLKRFTGSARYKLYVDACNFCEREDNILVYLDSTRLKDTKRFCCEKCETEWRERYDRSR